MVKQTLRSSPRRDEDDCVQTRFRCWAEIDLDALRSNLAWIRHRAGPRIKILTVVKADAYGHGLKQIAALLMQSGTDIFGVANLAEARTIRHVGRGWPILLLGVCLPEEMETVVRDQIMPTISSLNEAEQFAAIAKQLGQQVTVHVKVDSGMGRLGVSADKALALVEEVTRLRELKLQGLYTHYSSAEDDAEYSRFQRDRFSGVLRQLREARIEVPLIHANNSAALLHEPDTTFNLIRPGLLVYGIVPASAKRTLAIPARSVRPALALYCRVGFVKEIPRGTRLSYGQTFKAPRRMRVATLTAGYGDAYLRSGSNRAEVLIGGQRCRVLGNITMDQMLADVSRVPNARMGDRAVLIGAEGNESITASEVAAWCDTVPWEVLTNITYRVTRIYRGAQAA